MPLSLRERNKAERFSAILTTAKTLFQVEGVHNTSIEKIAASMNLGKGTVYNYFSSKDELYARIVLDFNQGLLDFLAKPLAQELRDKPVMQKLRKVIELYLSYHLQNQALTKIVLDCKSSIQWSNLSKPTQLLWQNYIEERHALTSHIIQQGVNEDIINGENVANLSNVGVGMLEGVIRLLIFTHEQYPYQSQENLTKLAEEILIRGLRY